MLAHGDHVLFQAGVDKMQNQFAFDGFPRSISTTHWCGRHQLPAGDAHWVGELDGDGGQLVGHQARKRILHSVPVAGDRHDRGVLPFDFFLFYVFWEVMLLPMYFLIGIWGGPREVRGHQVFLVHARG